MSIDYTIYVVFGIEEDAELRARREVQVSYTEIQCSNGHTVVWHSFCGQCGGKVAPKQVTKPSLTHHYEAYTQGFAFAGYGLVVLGVKVKEIEPRFNQGVWSLEVTPTMVETCMSFLRTIGRDNANPSLFLVSDAR